MVSCASCTAEFPETNLLCGKCGAMRGPLVTAVSDISQVKRRAGQWFLWAIFGVVALGIIGALYPNESQQKKPAAASVRSAAALEHPPRAEA